MLKEQAKEENDILRKISKSVVSFYGVSASVYQDWIETYLEKADNQKKLMSFRNGLRELAIKERPEVAKTDLLSTKQGCLEYAKKLFAKIEGPKSDLLVR